MATEFKNIVLSSGTSQLTGVAGAINGEQMIMVSSEVENNFDPLPYPITLSTVTNLEDITPASTVIPLLHTGGSMGGINGPYLALSYGVPGNAATNLTIGLNHERLIKVTWSDGRIKEFTCLLPEKFYTGVGTTTVTSAYSEVTKSNHCDTLPETDPFSGHSKKAVTAWATTNPTALPAYRTIVTKSHAPEYISDNSSFGSISTSPDASTINTNASVDDITDSSAVLTDWHAVNPLASSLLGIWGLYGSDIPSIPIWSGSPSASVLGTAGAGGRSGMLQRFGGSSTWGALIPGDHRVLRSGFGKYKIDISWHTNALPLGATVKVHISMFNHSM